MNNAISFRPRARPMKIVMASIMLWLASATKPPSSGMVLRIRLGDGSMQRIQVPPGSEDTTTLSEILSPVVKDTSSSSTIQVGSETISDDSQTLSTLGLKHGSLITIVPPKTTKKKEPSRFSKPHDENCFDPFPDLSRRDYALAIQRKARRHGGMSYGDLANVQSALHVVEPQPEGPLKRCYMCKISAERFQSNCLLKKSAKLESRVGLLFGSIQRERVKLKAVARTSLSSTPSEQDYCQVAKVHALWEPPQQASTQHYNAKSLVEDNASLKRALTVASWLGLTPVGWIFSYTDEKRLEDDDSLPVWGADVYTGARLQIANMQRNSKEGAKFVTLAMDANSGATEAFQLSDVSVQMVAEEMFSPGESSERFVQTKHEIIVDGKETTQLDSVLTLVNTAMLSHDGIFAGKATNSVKKSGTLTSKTKKKLVGVLEDDGKLLNALSDFNILVALDKLLPEKDSEELCKLVRKWARGQKRGTEVPSKLKLVLQSVLNT